MKTRMFTLLVSFIASVFFLNSFASPAEDDQRHSVIKNKNKMSEIVFIAPKGQLQLIQVQECSLNFATGGKGQVRLQNTSSVPSQNIGAVIPANSQIRVDSNTCPASLLPGQACEITFTSDQPEGPTNVVIQGNNTNILNVIITVSSVSLSISQQTLAIAEQGIFTPESGAGTMTSNSRQLIITNDGSTPANNVDYSISPALPSGTTVTPTTCGTISPGGDCILTISPGPMPSSPGGSAPAPSVITIQGINTNAVTSNLIILTYGNIFQDGFVFAIDDSTAITQSVGGKVAALTDESGDFQWTSDIFPQNAPATNFLDGKINTDNMVSTPTVYPAADQCRSRGSEWYLPAICEMGYDLSGFGTGCGELVAPTIQNLDSNLDNQGFGNFNTQLYWSSTQASSTFAWFQGFLFGQQGDDTKTTARVIRCVKVF